jgi:hypothetical protein
MYENPEDLIRRIQLGEDSTLELKEIRWKGKRIAGPGRNELADEICAFAIVGEEQSYWVLMIKQKTLQAFPRIT